MGDTLRNFNEYLLLGEKATKKAIIDALKDIASKASFDDYFIFNFSGYSTLHTSDSTNFSTYFFPFSNSPLFESVAKKNIPKDVVDSQLISLRTLQEYIQLIPANNQLFISEAGPSEKFKTEFIKSLMQNSPAVASLLNKNRVIIVPNGFGADDVKCEGNRINKGPINYYITSLDASENIYDF
ncbi:MAG: hypothetical protein IPO68_15680 [Chitinophagaceae bacterium]|nr:hypothetical protein [Chitinophagaceae bacterium]